MIDRGIAANLITRETDGTITLSEPGNRKTTKLLLFRGSILQGIDDWADQTLLYQDDSAPEVTCTWISSARAVKAHHWDQTTLEDGKSSTTS